MKTLHQKGKAFVFAVESKQLQKQVPVGRTRRQRRLDHGDHRGVQSGQRLLSLGQQICVQDSQQTANDRGVRFWQRLDSLRDGGQQVDAPGLGEFTEPPARGDRISRGTEKGVEILHWDRCGFRVQ